MSNLLNPKRDTHRAANKTQNSKLKTIFISTGEVSGDLQGSLLIEGLKRAAIAAGIDLEIVALGGDRMEAAGATMLGNTSAIGSLGLVESLPFVLPTLQLQRRAKQYLKSNPPDLVVLIDYAGPNLSLGHYIHKQLPKVPLVYYISPQVWVWWPFARDIKRIVEMTDLLLAIFPEEERYFKAKGANVTLVGHPLVDRMKTAPSREQARVKLGIEDSQMAIALLPASRPQELKYLMPVMFEAAKAIQNKLPDVHFWIPLSLEAYRLRIEQAIKDYGLQATLVTDKTKEVLAAADLAIAKSGTVNLELALLNVPQVVIYRVSPITYWLARILRFSISFMSPPNLVVMRQIVPELLQEQATPENIAQESFELLLNSEKRQQNLADYQEMQSLLGSAGVCDRAASAILDLL